MDIRQVANRSKYDLAASSYNLIAFLMSLGQASRLYAEVAQRLDLPPGGTVVELGCGPASVVPSILQKFGPSARFIGVDFSRSMIELANRKKAKGQWQNVQFECLDMYDFSPADKVDAVVFCLALTAMPDYRKALELAISILKPGGQLLIVDSFPLHSKWYHPITNGYIYLKSMVVGAKPVGAIVEFIKGKTAQCEQREMVSGVYTVLDARIAQA